MRRSKVERHPDAELHFQNGLASMLRQWTVLELAVHNQWGGPASAEKAANLNIELMNLFRTPEKIYKDDVALVLEDFLDTQFFTVCEDGSPDEIGEISCTMWRQCCTGDFSLVERTLSQERARGDIAKISVGMEAGDAIISDDEGEGGETGCATIEEGDDDDETESAEMETDAAGASAAVSITGPVIDEDGFQTVFRRSKRLSNKSGK